MYLQSLIFSFVFAVAPDTPPLVPDNELVHDDIDDIGPLSSIPEPDEPPRASGRQLAVAQVRRISVSHVVKDIAGRQPFQAVRDLDSTYVWSYFWITLFPTILWICSKGKTETLG